MKLKEGLISVGSKRAEARRCFSLVFVFRLSWRLRTTLRHRGARFHPPCVPVHTPDNTLVRGRPTPPRESWHTRRDDDDDYGDEDDRVLQNIQIQRTEDGHIAVAKRITRLSAPQSSHRALPWQNATPPSAARETPPRWLAWRQSDTTQRTGHVKNEPVRTRDLAGRPLLLRHPRLQERAQVLHRLDRHDRRGAVRDASARAAHWRDRSPVGRRTGAEERAPGGTKGRAVPREV